MKIRTGIITYHPTSFPRCPSLHGAGAADVTLRVAVGAVSQWWRGALRIEYPLELDVELAALALEPIAILHKGFASCESCLS